MSDLDAWLGVAGGGWLNKKCLPIWDNPGCETPNTQTEGTDMVSTTRPRRPRVDIRCDDPTQTSAAGLVLVAETADKPDMIATLDRHIPSIKQRQRGLTAGGLLLAWAEMMLAGSDFMCDLDVMRADQAGAHGGVVFGQHPPGAAGTHDGEDGVDDLAARVFLAPSQFGWRGQQRGDEVPLGVGEVGGVTALGCGKIPCSHTVRNWATGVGGATPSQSHTRSSAQRQDQAAQRGVSDVD